MENPLSFFRRGVRYISDYIAKQEEELLVATTSIMILMQNLSEMKGAGRGEGYRVREYQNAELVALEFGAPEIDWLNAQGVKYGV